MDEEILESYKIVVRALKEFFGKDVEIVLHSLIDNKPKIIAIENGEITGRKVGDSLTEAGKYVIEKLKNGIDYYGPYESLSYTRKKLRSITIGIRNKKGDLIGLLCLNMDLSNLEAMHKFISYFLTFADSPKEVLNKITSFEYDEAIEKTFDEVYSILSSKVSSKRVDNFSIVSELYNRSFFKLKNSVNFVAKKLNISIYTVYAYIRKLEKERGV
ncbi:helix-turn-helix transcriptional regulator [Caldisericum exile]|uniref:helix-turn-helix transcriptional regulator n=1 Tax=Caldisericum exile TaxID=693075 RepID=UPI003C74312C